MRKGLVRHRPFPRVEAIKYSIVMIHYVLLALLLEILYVISVGTDEEGNCVLSVYEIHQNYFAESLQRQEQHF